MWLPLDEPRKESGVTVMSLDMDVIRFESRAEIEETMRVLEKYVDAYPKEKDNRIVKDLYDLLDVMDMSW